MWRSVIQQVPLKGEMLSSALVQEGVSRGLSYLLGKREEKASQGNIRERLEMAANELERALEKSARLPMIDVSLLQRRKMIKRAYLEAAQLLDKYKQQHAVPAGQEQIDQGVKRRRWIISAKILSTSSFSGLTKEDVRRLEWYADCARKFVSDVESGCSLHHYTFCNPLVRYLLEGKTLMFSSTEQGNRLRKFDIWANCSEERGVEAVLDYTYKDDIVVEKSFSMRLCIRLSESTDIAWVATKCLQLLTSQFKIAVESAMGELTRLQDNSRPYVLPRVSSREEELSEFELNQTCRPYPECCKERRIGDCFDNVSSEVSHIFPENVIYFFFCSSVSALEYSSRSSSDEAGTSVRRDWYPHLELTVLVRPHYFDICLILLQIMDPNQSDDWWVEEFFPNSRYLIGGTLPQAAEFFFSRAISHFSNEPESTKYIIDWLSSKHGLSSIHGRATFWVEKPSTKIAGAPQTRRRYNTRASTKRIRR